jgi:hypothetical protein
MAGFGGAPSGFAAGVTAATGFLCGVFVIAVLAVGLRAGDLTTLALLAGASAAGATAASCFLGSALVIAGLAVGLRAADLTTLALLAGALVAGARLAAIVLADFFAAEVFAAGFFVVFFAAAAFFVFFVFFAIFVFPIIVADFPNHTGSACNGTARLSTQLLPVGCVGPADLWRSNALDALQSCSFGVVPPHCDPGRMELALPLDLCLKYNFGVSRCRTQHERAQARTPWKSTGRSGPRGRKA